MRSKKGVRAAALIGVCMLALTGCARSDAKSAYEKGCEALKRQETDSAMTYFNGVKMEFDYEIRFTKDNALACTGHSAHCFVNENHRPIKIRKRIRNFRFFFGF